MLRGSDGRPLTPRVPSTLSLICGCHTMSPDGPRLDERDCLGNWTWPEGSEQTLECQAWGNPPPQLTCRREDGAPLPIGEVKAVKWEMNGTYKCHASSAHGNVTRDVHVTVLCEYPRI